MAGGKNKADTQACGLGHSTQGRVFVEMGETGWGSVFRSKAAEFPVGLELEEPGRHIGGDVQFVLGWKGPWLRTRGPGRG